MESLLIVCQFLTACGFTVRMQGATPRSRGHIYTAPIEACPDHTLCG